MPVSQVAALGTIPQCQFLKEYDIDSVCMWQWEGSKEGENEKKGEVTQKNPFQVLELPQ